MRTEETPSEYSGFGIVLRMLPAGMYHIGFQKKLLYLKSIVYIKKIKENWDEPFTVFKNTLLNIKNYKFDYLTLMAAQKEREKRLSVKQLSKLDRYVGILIDYQCLDNVNTPHSFKHRYKREYRSILNKRFDRVFLNQPQSHSLTQIRHRNHHRRLRNRVVEASISLGTLIPIPELLPDDELVSTLPSSLHRFVDMLLSLSLSMQGVRGWEKVNGVMVPFVFDESNG
ncbi:hypothetical protein GQX74_001260 [Glossina fuscipes]|nr:hypothetical protein GQX74_001260 [Glossina fuscipes]